jgi:hypothetical protein
MIPCYLFFYHCITNTHMIFMTGSIALYLKLAYYHSSSFRMEFSGGLVLEFPVLHETSLFCACFWISSFVSGSVGL